MPTPNDRKKELDKKRSVWRKTHRTLKGRIILYPNKKPEHINARANKTYNWFWKKILLVIKVQEIPAIISTIREKIRGENDTRKIRTYRTMIGMAEDAYQLKNLDDILEVDSELQIEAKPIYNSEQGLIYKDGKIYSLDYNEDETKIILRDNEGIIVDTQSASIREDETLTQIVRNTSYKNWKY